MTDKYISAATLKQMLLMKPEEWGTPDERWRPESEIGARIDACLAADVAEIDSIEKALLERCTINSYGGLTKADVINVMKQFRRKDDD